MTDPISTLAKIPPSLIDLGSDGALSEMRKQILPDVGALLRDKSNEAHDAAWFAVLRVVRALVARALGTAPNSEDVWRFINDGANDKAFAARVERLVGQCVRTPNERRRRMLALALFSPASDPEIRDEVDAAIEMLEPVDVDLLRSLDEHDPDRGGYYVGHVGVRGNPEKHTLGLQRKLSFTRIRDVARLDHTLVWECSVSSLMRLRSAACIDLGHVEGVSSLTVNALRRLDVLTLGRDVLQVLKDERAIADIDASAQVRVAPIDEGDAR